MPAASRDDKQHRHRLSVSLSDEQYGLLVEIAQRKRVSLAWVMREAAERLLRDEMPLFHTKQPNAARKL